MKHLKTFEDNQFKDEYIPNKYWLIPTDHRYLFALKKLEMSEYFLNNFLENKNIPRNSYIFVCNYIWFNKEQWTWNKYNNEEHDSFFEEKGNIYMGRIDISDEEIASIKYNL